MIRGHGLTFQLWV